MPTACPQSTGKGADTPVWRSESCPGSCGMERYLPTLFSWSCVHTLVPPRVLEVQLDSQMLGIGLQQSPLTHGGNVPGSQ